MPKGTRVHRCVENCKRKGGNVNCYAVCQATTGQSFATGKPLKDHERSSTIRHLKDHGLHKRD
jgi:hypothetical protein